MKTTRVSLLERVRDRSDAVAWRELYDVYAPLLFDYARGRGLSRADAEEIRDQCLAVVAEKIAAFEYDRARGGFRCWLRSIAERKVIDLWRKRRQKRGSSVLKTLREPSLSPAQLWEEHWRLNLMRRTVNGLRGEVPALVYEAFRLIVFEELSVEEVSARLGMNANQIYKAKARCLARVRETLTRLEAEVL